jgi:hypothetical protein
MTRSTWVTVRLPGASTAPATRTSTRFHAGAVKQERNTDSHATKAGETRCGSASFSSCDSRRSAGSRGVTLGVRHRPAGYASAVSDAVEVGRGEVRRRAAGDVDHAGACGPIADRWHLRRRRSAMPTPSSAVCPRRGSTGRRRWSIATAGCAPCNRPGRCRWRACISLPLRCCRAAASSPCRSLDTLRGIVRAPRRGEVLSGDERI